MEPLTHPYGPGLTGQRSRGDQNLPKKRKRSDPLTPIAALTIICIAILTGASLRLLLRIQKGVAHIDATEQFVAEGRSIVAQISIAVSRIPQTPNSSDWKSLSTLVSGIENLAHGLQYVEVTDDDVTIFHEQAGPLLPDGTRQPLMLPFLQNIEIGKKRLDMGKRKVDVVVFRKALGNKSDRVIEVGIRHEGVENQNISAITAATSMYRLSLSTVLIGFGACAVLLAIMIRREQRRKDRRREEEHLAFSGVLANGIVHDFRNPMNAVRLDAQMLEREANRNEQFRMERVHTLAARIKRTMDRMDKVFKEFLYLSRPSPEGNEKLDILTCLRECVDILSPRAEQAGVNITYELPDTPLWVNAPSGAIRRAIVNVLNNALQFSAKDGRVRITASVKGKNVIVNIMDRGPGIPHAQRKHVFEMFVSHRPEGTGLGLFLARTAIEKCNGRIVALDREGGGTCIQLRFPVVKQMEDK